MPPPLLGVHVIGECFGESIVLELPCGRVGVVDCFARRLKVKPEQRIAANPTLHFLRQHLKIERLAFLAFTHPHEDHGRGLSHLLEEFADHIDELWVYDGFELTDLEQYFRRRVEGDSRLDIERLLGEPAGIFATELMRIRELVLRQADERNPNGASYRRLIGYKRFALGDVTFHVLGPTDPIVKEYSQRLTANLKEVLPDRGRTVDADWEPSEVNHNLISPALLVQYGEASVLLGGDMEAEAWYAVLHDPDAEGMGRPPLWCQLVKVSHHGSITGLVPGLYDQFRKPGREAPGVVLTPFVRHRSPLPSGEGLDHLVANASTVIATNQEVANRTAGRTPMPDLPAQWRDDVATKPSLSHLLIPELRRGVAGPPPQSVPSNWEADVRKNLELARLLAPDYRDQFDPPPVPPEQVHERFRVSYFFDDAGRVVDRYVASNAGQLF